MGEEIPSVNIHSVPVTRGSWPLWATDNMDKSQGMLYWSSSFRMNEFIDLKGMTELRKHEHRNQSLHKGALCLKIYWTCRDKFFMLMLTVTPLPSWIHSGFLSKAACNIAIWRIRWFIPVLFYQYRNPQIKKGDFFSLIHTLKAIYLCNSINGVPSNISYTLIFFDEIILCANFHFPRFYAGSIISGEHQHHKAS